MCLVITPLIALMKDQVENLRSRGIKALALHSGMSAMEIKTTLDNAVWGDYKFLYVSPERLESERFTERLKQMTINLITVDEAHCISQWGYDFRPSYLKIAALRKLLPGIPVLALTATATPVVVKDIQEKLLFPLQNVLSMSFARSNLAYMVREKEDKLGYLVRTLQRAREAASYMCGTAGVQGKLPNCCEKVQFRPIFTMPDSAGKCAIAVRMSGSAVKPG